MFHRHVKTDVLLHCLWMFQQIFNTVVLLFVVLHPRQLRISDSQGVGTHFEPFVWTVSVKSHVDPFPHQDLRVVGGACDTL